jgi:uncharacterized protein YjbI with pentapeptide repeats
MKEVYSHTIIRARIKKTDFKLNKTKNSTMKRINFFLLLLLPALSFAQTKVAASTILEQLNGGEVVAYNNVHIIGNLDLTKLRNVQAKQQEHIQDDRGDRKVFYDQKRFVSLVLTPVTFTNCKFTGELIAFSQPVQDTMYEADFIEPVRFSGCVFEKKATFRHSWFKKEVSFSNCRFESGVDFRHSYFARLTSFNGTTFSKEIDFRHTTFYKGTDFQKTKFDAVADFRHTTFSEGADFRHVMFLAEASFRHTAFEQKPMFEEASFRIGSDFSHALLNGEPVSFTKVDGKIVLKKRGNEVEQQETEPGEIEQ